MCGGLNHWKTSKFCGNPQLLETVCQLYPIHVFKLDRLYLELTKILLEDSSLSRFLKIVYLVRDPRAIHASRYTRGHSSTLRANLARCLLLLEPCSLLLEPCSLLLEPYSLLLGPCSLLLGPCSLLLGPCSLLLGTLLAIIRTLLALLGPCSLLLGKIEIQTFLKNCKMGSKIPKLCSRNAL